MIKISERQLAVFHAKAIEDSVTEAMGQYPAQTAALPDRLAFHRTCRDLALAYGLNDGNHVLALVALCLDLGPRREAFFAQPEIAALPEACAMEGHQRLHLAGVSAYSQGLLQGGGA